MYDHSLYQSVNKIVGSQLAVAGKNNPFYTRLLANIAEVSVLFAQIYGGEKNNHPAFISLLQTILDGYRQRPATLVERDLWKLDEGHWFLSNNIAGMSLYVDRFCGTLKELAGKLDYFEELGVNFLHLMPVFESPADESDGGYAVSNFRKVDERFGTTEDLIALQQTMQKRNMYLMLDIVLNHTSQQHEWATLARMGDTHYQDFYYFFNDRTLPDEYDKTMPDIFPESSPGNFTYIPELGKWVMSVFHHYQWDLNYSNPQVFIKMLDNIFYYANLGVDVLRIDAPAFIWKQLGTTSQNLPQAHTLLKLIKLCVEIAAPGMALLGEAIVAPKEIMKYFGTGRFAAHECDVAYNATQMALQWDALATGNIKIMLAAQHEILKKPYGTTWITYTRCHDDIGLGYDDYTIEQAGLNAHPHRSYLKEFYSGAYPGSFSMGALFSVNPKNGDARISGSLASLCGLEKALLDSDEKETELAIKRILLMQAQSFFIGGIPMIFYGDELGYTNDYSYLNDPAKSYDNRWMHRPVFDWQKMKQAKVEETIEKQIFDGTKHLLTIRKRIPIFRDHSNLTWVTPHNDHVAGFVRAIGDMQVYCLFNFSNQVAYVTWYTFKEKGHPPLRLYDHWLEKEHVVGADHEYLVMEPYTFCVMEPVE